ncbi:ribonuclease H-like domain-containing protein [Xanthomonas translucens pv. translucens]|uniref:Ribonuclease H-like domain-containing protein n=5 Tax=Xanthomonas campestris pv. translucens TaxID=343 RepID=A0ABW9KUZ9_XANCT|nr:ribonuclease H-like domain-containing protein [Xanthomonas translucens]
MSISLERLRALRKQAGDPSVDAPRAPAPGARPAGNAVAAGTPASATAPARAATPAGRATLLRKPPRDTDAAPLPPAPRTPLPARSGDTAVAVAPPIAIKPFDRRGADVASLRRLLGMRERVVAPAAAPRKPQAADRHLPGMEIAPGLHLIEAFLPQPIPAAALSLAFARREDAVQPSDLLFFDTETTGLAGGTGTRAFMIGAADWSLHPVEGPGLRIRQLMMATMGAEKAMLEAFRAWLAPTTVLSSYNGRCYDAPLLKTRYRLARCADPLSALDHVDLLHPTRRRYRGTWENCKLSTIERQLLRIVREDDLPGSEAPAAWLSYLRGGSARNLRRVAAHNHQDVVTLALLLQRLVDAEAEEREVVPFAEAP